MNEIPDSRWASRDLTESFCIIAFTKMLPNIAKEGDDIQISGPLQVVDDNGNIVSAKVDKLGDLIANARHPTLNRCSIVQGTLGALERRIAYQSGGSTYQRNRTVAKELKPSQRQ